MQHFTPVNALLGGALIGAGASALLFLTGRVAGISGIVGGLLRPADGARGWRAAFVVGLLAGGGVLMAVDRQAIGDPLRSLPGLVVAGVLVGFGARLGGGCTSGHGVCGLARLSPRSAWATGAFMLTGVAAATLARLTGWFAP